MNKDIKIKIYLIRLFGRKIKTSLNTEQIYLGRSGSMLELIRIRANNLSDLDSRTKRMYCDDLNNNYVYYIFDMSDEFLKSSALKVFSLKELMMEKKRKITVDMEFILTHVFFVKSTGSRLIIRSEHNKLPAICFYRVNFKAAMRNVFDMIRCSDISFLKNESGRTESV